MISAFHPVMDREYAFSQYSAFYDMDNVLWWKFAHRLCW